ncbi:MAG: hypothetical protein PUC16_00065 [Bacteroidales bacterium]|nr:hypothetical protein [Bacteroidales bacterium]
MQTKQKIVIKMLLYGLIVVVTSRLNIAYSQSLSTFGVETANYFTIASDRAYVSHEQRVLHVNEKEIVIFNKSSEGRRASFTYMNQWNDTCKYAEISSNYTVNDFDILNDTIYFCGRHSVSNDTLPHGFVAYVSVADLFSSQADRCTYSDIRSMTNVQKVLAYHNNANEIVAAVFGTQYYADVVYIPEPNEEVIDTFQGPELPLDPGLGPFKSIIVGDNPAKSSSAYDDLGMGWHNDTIRFWDCFAALKIKNMHTDSLEHKYDLWRFFYKKGVEVARDMCLTDDYICIISSYYMENIDCSPKNEFIIHRINKNDFTDQVSNKMIGAYFCYSDTFDLLKATCVGGNEIALCYTAVSSSSSYGNILYKINLSSNVFTSSISHFIDNDCAIKPHVWDLKYNKQSNTLLVLKEDGNSSPVTDEVWYLSMNPSVITPYSANVLNIYNEHFGFNNELKLSSLDRRSSDYMLIAGCAGDTMTITEKNVLGFNSENYCSVIETREIIAESSPTFAADSLMEHCRFIVLANSRHNGVIQQVLNLPADATIGNIIYNPYEQEIRKRVCLNKGINYYYVEPISR